MNPHSSSLFLPPELKKILNEVARTGKCNSLPWTASDIRSVKASSKRRQSSVHVMNSSSENKKRKRLQQPSLEEQGEGGGGGGDVVASPLLQANKTVMSPHEGSSSISSYVATSSCKIVHDHSNVKSSASKVSNASKVSAVSRTEIKAKAEPEEEDVVVEEEEEEFEKEYNGEESVRATEDREKRKGMHSTGVSRVNGKVSVEGTYEDAVTLANHDSKRVHEDVVFTGTGLNAKNTCGIEKAADAVIGAMEKKRVNRGLYNHRDQSCASSCCSESVSSTGGGSTISVPSSLASMGPLGISLPFRTLRGALRLAVALVLEYSYKNRGGYKLSPAEKRRFQMFQKQQNQQQQEHHRPTSFMDIAFMERRIRLLKMLGGGKSARGSTSSVTRVMSGSASDGGFTSDTSFESVMRKNSGGGGKDFGTTTITAAAPSRWNDSGPPFTIQRVAEVLLMPERYYGQTHKLCNALEKLLLVTSPSTAFGGIMGGDSLPPYRRGDDREMNASLVAERKERDESSEYGHASGQLKRRISFSSSSSDGCDPIIQMNVSVKTCESAARKQVQSTNDIHPDGHIIDEDGNASIGHLHDHHSPSHATSCDSSGSSDRITKLTTNSDNRAGITEAEDSLTSEYPLRHSSGPLQGNHSLSSASGPPLMQLSTSNNNNRPPSPSLYSPHGSFNNAIRNNQKSAMLQGQNRRLGDPNSLLTSRQNVQMEILIDPSTDGNNAHSSVQNNVNSADVAFLETISGRSSASNSDIDSESDDISFDDSASDRSDGSDFDTGAMASLSEPFAAARVMALNRMQQQHRREQYLQDRALRQVAMFQPPPDSEYQSGDSVDSALAEDSCGSDSSSSDFTD